MHCLTGLDYSNSEQKRRKPVENQFKPARSKSLSAIMDDYISDAHLVEVLDLLWTKCLLEGKTSKMLLDTVVFYNGLYFALQSGREHRQLRHSSCQVKVVEKPGERPYLLYHKDTSKNHLGGLKGRKTTPKVVVHHSNTKNPERCFVTLFKKYRKLCPDDPVANAFYLQPSRSPTETCWYTRQPLGHSTLGGIVARLAQLCKEAGIQDYKTNHSLRACNRHH